MKHYIPLILLFLICIPRVSNAQSPADCEGALPFCDPVNEGLGTVLSVGNVTNEVNPNISCVDHENYSTWYRFTPTSNGTFTFVLTPINGQDDYDWALFDITGSSCGQIPTDGNLLVSCNSWGDFNWNGATGISSANGGTGNSNGPGTFNGPPFNEDFNVTAGHNYVLMVSNWSNSSSGFTINTSGSTAQGVYAETNLTVAPDQLICLGEDQVDIYSNFTGTILNAISYSWTPANLFVNPKVEDPVLKDTLKTSTQFTLNFKNGDCPVTRSTNVVVASIDYNKQDKNQNVCLGEVSELNLDFTGVISPGGLQYTWSPANLLNNPNLATPTTVQLTDTTQFYFHIVNGPCEVYDSLKVFVWTDTVNADFDFIFNDDLATIPVEVDFVNQSSGDLFNLWDFGDGSDSSTQRSPQQHPFPGYDRYTVTLIATSSSSYCRDTAVKEIVFPEIEFPNIITPNNDAQNDAFWVTGLRIGTDLRVYNRWGKLVYEATDYLHDWTAPEQPDGMYFYEFIDPKGIKTKGWLRVSR